MPGRIFNFGPFEIAIEDQRLSRGNKRIGLGRTPFAVLACLVERAGNLVTKELLFQEVWPDAIVSEASLTDCIRQIRKALEDSSGKDAKFIRTVHGSGYRFIAEVREQAVDLSAQEKFSDIFDEGGVEYLSDLLGVEFSDLISLLRQARASKNSQEAMDARREKRKHVETIARIPGFPRQACTV